MYHVESSLWLDFSQWHSFDIVSGWTLACEPLLLVISAPYLHLWEGIWDTELRVQSLEFRSSLQARLLHMYPDTT